MFCTKPFNSKDFIKVGTVKLYESLCLMRNKKGILNSHSSNLVKNILSLSIKYQTVNPQLSIILSCEMAVL